MNTPCMAFEPCYTFCRLAAPLLKSQIFKTWPHENRLSHNRFEATRKRRAAPHERCAAHRLGGGSMARGAVREAGIRLTPQKGGEARPLMSRFGL